MANSKREKIKLKSSKSTYFYYTVKNKSSTPDRLTLKKYDPTIREHVEFKETKQLKDYKTPLIRGVFLSF